MADKQVILVGGGSRSGKSDFALGLARRLGNRPLFVATAQAGDEEMSARIRRHQQTRGHEFTTIEEPLAVAEVFNFVGQASSLPESASGFSGQARSLPYDVIVLDCLTIWLANLLLRGDDADAVLRQVDRFIEIVDRRSTHAVIVTSEVGLGLVPETPLGRTFRDVAGLAHQRLAATADEVYFGVMGVMLRLKPSPLIPILEGRIP